MSSRALVWWGTDLKCQVATDSDLLAMSERPKRPWWMLFLGSVPQGIEAGHLRLLGVVALALLFEEYDLAVLNLALSPIAADLGIQVDELAGYLKWIRAGALPAFLVVPLADRIGRRPVFVASTALMGLLTFATAFVQTPMQFVLCQSLTRGFFLTGSAVAFVIITEEFPARHRGWGMGILAALGAVGHGMAAAMYAAAQAFPHGWRGLYALGIVPLLLTPLFLARIPETKRFAQQRPVGAREGNALAHALLPLWLLVRRHPGRGLGVAFASALSAWATWPSFQFSGLFVQRFHGWTNAQLSMMVLGAGAVGIVGNVVAGRLGDLFGRKSVGFVLLGAFPVASYGLYNAGGAGIPTSFAALVFCSMGGRLMLRALAAELFPTAERGASSGLYAVFDTVGAVLGLWAIEIYQLKEVAEMQRVVPVVACTIWLAALVLAAFPETRQRELEELS